MVGMEYLLSLAAALVICMMLTMLRLKQRGLKPVIAAAAIPVCGVLGVGCAWGFYKVLMFMMRVSAYEYCFVGGMLGVVLGLVILAKAFQQPVWAVLDAAAAPLCLMVCMARLGEYFVKLVGWGKSLTGSGWYYRFPFMVNLEYDDYFEEWSGNLAVFMLEAVLALLVFVIVLALFDQKRHRGTGLAFERGMLLLIIPQIFSEQLRSLTMSWGFVRVEQIMCAILAALILGRSCWIYGKKGGSFAKVWWPIAALLVCVGVVILSEFTLDGKFIDIPVAGSYALFIGGLLCMIALEEYAVHRRIKA